MSSVLLHHPAYALTFQTPAQVGFKVAGPTLDILPQDLSQGPMLAYSRAAWSIQAMTSWLHYDLSEQRLDPY